MNEPKNMDLYLEVEKMIFISSIQYADVMYLIVKGKVQFIDTPLQIT